MVRLRSSSDRVDFVGPWLCLVRFNSSSLSVPPWKREIRFFTKKMICTNVVEKKNGISSISTSMDLDGKRNPHPTASFSFKWSFSWCRTNSGVLQQCKFHIYYSPSDCCFSEFSWKLQIPISGIFATKHVTKSSIYKTIIPFSKKPIGFEIFAKMFETKISKNTVHPHRQKKKNVKNCEIRNDQELNPYSD